ncbi:ROK family protein [Lactiplantibacillus plantarum]|uniref:ROK family protein n=1 Tax=Lactiplantibacillus plantarum TaxID=1590 RepID=UPI001F4C54D8|nr:ROK family protein [Lactiplantibacillus plantarum]MCH8625408.1 ROK family protein [Lactiplantibacillus plantarum]MCH8630402.1 ROK family protein [Lactiplantibacillus plantarum]MCH8633408.1 ROK family protein [Lactiplantibacillus plantarum]MCT4450700.1 ROK family protein [Lactiplantibacillus plantarum]MCT4460533.1 ROK family protein [Lactiplantibacillus plantarum]
MKQRSLGRDQLHDLNLKLVLQQIINHPATSRIEISHELALHKSTISSLYNTLMDQELLKEIGQGAASNVGGRKPMMVTINQNYGYTVTFDLGYRHLHATANYIDAAIIKYQRIEVSGQPIAKMVKECKKFLDDLPHEVATVNGLLGICFSIHGIILDNRIIDSPWIDMQNTDLVSVFEGKYHVPVLLENEANLSAIYTRDFNRGQPYSSFVTLSIHRGIGAGVVLNQHLLHGENGRGGEIGKTLTSLGPNVAAQSVESLCSEDALITRIEHAKRVAGLDRDAIVSLFLSGDRDAERILRQSCGVIAGLIFNVVTMFDPQAVFINSPLIEKLPGLIEEIRGNYKDVAASDFPIHLIPKTRDVTLLGGSSLITHHVLNLDDYELHFRQHE